jgi:ketosteroid isomerase-like protein
MHALIALMLAATAPDDSLTAFADAFDRAQLAQDRAAMERMVADDLVFVDGSGKRQGKKEFIEGWMTPGDRYDPLVLVDRVIVPLGPDAGVVNAETNLTGISGGKRFASHFRYADSFRRVGGKWQVAHIQVTRMAASQP